MVYQMHDNFVVGQPDASSLGDIKILFNGDAVPRVVVTQLAVWNAGNTTVRGNDIVEADPLAVGIDPGSSILGTGLLSATRTVNDFHIRVMAQDRSRAFLDFDYLDPGDGAVFQIIHSGAKCTARVTGSLRGIPRGLENWGDLEEWVVRKNRLIRILSESIPQLLLLVVVALGLKWSSALLTTHFPATAKYFPLFQGRSKVIAEIFLFTSPIG